MEDAARRLRHGFFQETARALGLVKLALGHTADDQVETLLQRLLRGAGCQGLGGRRRAGIGHVQQLDPRGLAQPQHGDALTPRDRRHR